MIAMITSKVQNATIPYQHTHSHLPQDNRGLFGGKLERNGQGITLNSTQIFTSLFQTIINHFSSIFPFLGRVCLQQNSSFGGFISDEILWKHLSKVSVLCKREDGPQLAQSNHFSSHLSPLKQHYQPQEAITPLNLHISDLKSLAGRSLHWPSQLSTSSTPLLTVYL